MSSPLIIAVAIAVVLGAIVLFITVVLIYICCFCTFKLKANTHPLQKVYKRNTLKKDEESMIDTTNHSMVAFRSFRGSPISQVTSTGEIIIPFIYDVSNQSLSQEYVDAESERPQIEELDEKDPTDPKRICDTPPEFYQEYVSSSATVDLDDTQLNESLSRTLMIQDLVEETVDASENSDYIKKVADPYSENVISIGSIVVVVKSFSGKDEYEFEYLQIGDLLRIIKFYCRPLSIDSGNKSFKLKGLEKGQGGIWVENIHANTKLNKSSSLSHSGSASSKSSEEYYISASNALYDQIYCTGVLLNTYLEFDDERDRLCLKFKDNSESLDSSLMKDFPLQCISLETTILTNMEI